MTVNADTLNGKSDTQFVRSDQKTLLIEQITFNPTAQEQPPFVVGIQCFNRAVPGLNSDRVDGYDATSFELTVNKGAASGYCDLNASGKVPIDRLEEVLGLTDLSDVASKTGTGSVAVMQASPALTTPTIGDFSNSTHTHTTAAGGGVLQANGALVFYITGAQTTGTNKGPIDLYVPFALTILEVHIALDTAPIGTSFIVDVNQNGTTIFTTQTNRPEIADGANSDTSGAPDVTTIAKNDVVTIDVDQIGSGTAGSDLVVQVRYKNVTTT